MTTSDLAAAAAGTTTGAGRSRAALWAAGVEHLEQFIAAHGHARVPQGFMCEDGMRLGSWVMRRREDRRRGADRLTAERIAQLDALGFDWTPPVRRLTIDDFAADWPAGIAHLTQFLTEHGHADVPPSWVCQDGFQLGPWVTCRRSERRNQRQAMTPQRIAQLDALGFHWGTNATRSELEEQRWADAVAHLADYVTEHEHARVPQLFTCEDGFRLGTWVARRRVDRRQKRRSLTPERIARLDALGFDWGSARPKN